MILKFKLLTAALLFCIVSCFAQDEKIDTDRPDQTESPSTAPKKWIQFEAGFLKQVDRNPAPNQQRFKDLEFEHPSILTRYGLAKCFELRLLTTYATSRGKEDNTIIDRQNGISSVQLGGKLNFFSEKGIRPKTSLIAHYDFSRLRTLYKDTIDGASFCFAMANTISEKVALGYNLGMEWGRFGEPPAYIYTLSPGFNISDNLYGFIELYGSLFKNEKPENSIDAGLSFCVNPDLKLDISSGVGMSKAAPDWFISIGASIRFKVAK